MPRARMLKRASTVPLKLDAAANDGGGPHSETRQHELTLRSLDLSRLRLTLEVSRDGFDDGRYLLRCGLSAGLQIELPTPWFVPKMAIEAAGSLLLKVHTYTCPFFLAAYCSLVLPGTSSW